MRAREGEVVARLTGGQVVVRLTEEGGGGGSMPIAGARSGLRWPSKTPMAAAED
ncbi:ATP-dependent helicase [Sesbania bispinosa]|nr:ATP-dependent helicase [Sesbania bispinosa]